MIVGGGVFAYGITNIVELVSSLTVHETRFREKMDEVNAYMKARELPMKLRMEIREFYHNARQSRDSKLNPEQQILNELSSKLRSKVALSINDQFLRKFPFFAGSDPNFLLELALNMRMIHFAPLEDVIIEGEIGHEMFFIFRGAVEVLRAGVQIGILGENQYFGEMAILSADNRRTATVRTLCFCELRMLSRNRFLEALTLFPAMQAKMAQVAKGRMVAPHDDMVGGNRKVGPTPSVAIEPTATEPTAAGPTEPPTRSPSVNPIASPLARLHQAEQRTMNPFIGSPRTTQSSGRLNSILRRPSNPTSSLTPSMALALTESTSMIDELVIRQSTLMKRIGELENDLHRCP